MTTHYTLYIANKNYSSWSLRPWVLMKELNIGFEEQLIPFIEGSNWISFREFSPNGTVPCLHADNQIVWDSLSIIEHLAENHSSVWPKDNVARAWARSAAAEMHSGFTAIRNDCTMTCGQRIQLHAISKSLQANIDRIDELWNEGLNRFGGPFLAGSTFSAVDAFYAPIAFRIRTYDLTLSQSSLDYVNRLLQLSSMQEWDKAALAETWREESHEKDATDSGTITEDFRSS